MMSRRLLGETLVDLASGAFEAAAATSALSVRRLALTVPIEFRLLHAAAGWDLVGDLPQAVRRTAFDLVPGRVAITWIAEDTP